MSNNRQVTTLPLVRLALRDDDDAKQGKKPIMRVVLEFEGQTFHREACLSASGKVKFLAWTNENGDVVKVPPTAVVAEFKKQVKDFERCALHGWIDVQLVVLNETEYWSENIKDRAGQVFCTYFYDAQRVTHCCEATPSYELEPLYSNPANYLDDDKAREKLHDDISEAQTADNCYMHCHRVESMPATHREAWGCIPIDPDEGDSPEEGYRKQMEWVREQLQGNVRLEVPSDVL